MKSYSPVLVFFLILCCSFAHASQEVLVIQSLEVKPYEIALQGFKTTCNCNIKKIVISELEKHDIMDDIHTTKPDIILAIGMNALKKVKEIKNIPIIYLMVLNPQSILSAEENITGISMNISPEIQLDLFKKLIPDIKNIGILSNPANIGDFIKEARNFADQIGITLISEDVNDPKAVPILLKNMKNEINAFWMIPDTAIITTETVESLFLFSIVNKIPIFTFSDKFLEMGALVSLNIDELDLGKQAGEMARDILSGKNIKNIPPSDARKTELKINPTMMKKLGIRINEEIVKKAKIIQSDAK